RRKLLRSTTSVERKSSHRAKQSRWRWPLPEGRGMWPRRHGPSRLAAKGFRSDRNPRLRSRPWRYRRAAGSRPRWLPTTAEGSWRRMCKVSLAKQSSVQIYLHTALPAELLPPLKRRRATCHYRPGRRPGELLPLELWSGQLWRPTVRASPMAKALRAVIHNLLLPSALASYSECGSVLDFFTRSGSKCGYDIGSPHRAQARSMSRAKRGGVKISIQRCGNAVRAPTAAEPSRWSSETWRNARRESLSLGNPASKLKRRA